MSAIAWVRGSTLANAVRAPGSALMGNSAPAKNHGRMATTGVAPMYSSWLGMRLAIVSATPYMRTAKPHGRDDEPDDAGRADVEVGAAQGGDPDEDGDLQGTEHERDGEVAEHEQRARDRARPAARAERRCRGR